MKTLAVMLALTLVIPVFPAEPGEHKVKYSGGSLQSVKNGNELKLFIEPAEIRLLKGKKDAPTIIKTSAVTEISYGQEVHRRIGTAAGLAVITLGVGAIVAFSKSKKHYIGVTWDDGTGDKGGIVLQADKDEFRGILTALEGVTGKKSVDTDPAKK